MKFQKVKVDLMPHERQPVRIVADGAISTRRLSGGRLIPVVILDTSERPDIEELIRVHATIDRPGDAKTQWCQLNDNEANAGLVQVPNAR